MKLVVSLAILVTALLVISNAAFATVGCDQELCYYLTYTDDQGAVVWENPARFCLNNTGKGTFYAYIDDFGCNLFLFGGGPGWSNATGDPALGGHPNWSQWLVVQCSPANAAYSLTPMFGSGGYLLSGVEQYGSDRYAVTGVQVPMSNCHD